MAIKLHLGVTDLPYAENASWKKAGVKKPKLGTSFKGTTGDVAEILEEKYHVMRIFFELHEKDIAKDLEKSLGGALENVLMGGPKSATPFGEAESKIQERFKSFLSNKEMDRLGYPGVPTQAALKGVSHRFKHPYARRPARPSFIDTGLYQASFKSWVDES